MIKYPTGLGEYDDGELIAELSTRLSSELVILPYKKSKEKLLSDEELREMIIDITHPIKIRASRGARVYSYHIDKIQRDIQRLISTQKRLYANMVIGEDETEDIDLSKRAKSRWGVRARNSVRREQRARIK